MENDVKNKPSIEMVNVKVPVDLHTQVKLESVRRRESMVKTYTDVISAGLVSITNNQPAA